MMYHFDSIKPVKVWPDAKPLTKVARNRTQPRIAGMRVVILITVKINSVNYPTGDRVNQTCLGILHLSGQEYGFPPGRFIPLRAHGYQYRV
jgi:hypothetical protein